MSAFRIKNIDTGVIDAWVFRINDAGVIEGDDVVAQDPNELAQAVSDTQHEVVKTGTYSPAVLIHATEGALSRIKTIEDTVGSTSLQDAYDNGRFIVVAPGLPLSLGASGEMLLDSSGNLTVNTNTFKVTDGVNDMFLTEGGVTSANSDLAFSTTGGAIDLTLSSARDLFLKDSNLTSGIPISETGVLSLDTTAQSIIGAINEVSTGFSGIDFQQIYDQSSPATVTTTFGGGPITFTNGSGNPSTPALIIDGGISTVDFIDADQITVGPGAAVNITIDTDGSIDTVADIETSTKVITPRVENPTAELLLLDSRGSANLTEIGEGSLGTVNQSIFGAINELNTLSSANALSLAALDIEHDLSTGLHEIINTQSGVGQEATSRLNIKDSGGTARIEMDANGNITAVTMDLGIYDVISELAANVAHRADDGTSHSAVAAHFAASNPHSVVKSFAKSGDTALSGAVTLSEGTGIGLTQVGQDIEVAVDSSLDLQLVYDNNADGDLDLDTTGGKDLFFKDSAAALILGLKSTAVEVNKNISILNTPATMSGAGDLTITAVTDLTLTSPLENLIIDAPTVGKTTSIQGIDFTNGTAASLATALPQDVISAINALSNELYVVLENSTGVSVPRGTAVAVSDLGKFWIPYPNILESNLVSNASLDAEAYWRATGVTDEVIAAGATGRVRLKGEMAEDVGEMEVGVDWKAGDVLYVSRVGYSELDFVSIGALANNDTITFDTATANKVYTAQTAGADPALGEFNIDVDGDANAAADNTRDNLLTTLNNETYMDVATDFFMKAFVAGDTAEGRVTITGVGSVSDTLVLTPGASIPGATITLTSVANGTTPTWLQYELGLTTGETAIHLADAVNRTYAWDGPDPGTAGVGHFCKATAYGDYIDLEWRSPGQMGNSMVISDTSAGITSPGNLTGGEAKVHVYRSERAANGILCTESNASALTCADFTDDEGTSQFMDQRSWFGSQRLREDDDRRIKVGRVTNWADPVLTFIVEPEEPKKNTRSIKGRINDTES